MTSVILSDSFLSKINLNCLFSRYMQKISVWTCIKTSCSIQVLIECKEYKQIFTYKIHLSSVKTLFGNDIGMKYKAFPLVKTNKLYLGGFF
jgi:hypothetical protein